MEIKSVGIIGGTGPAGSGLSMRLKKAGLNQVVIGSRSKQKAEEKANELSLRVGLEILGGTNEEAAKSELVILAIPYSSIADIVKPLKPLLAGKIVVSMVNALEKIGTNIIPLTLPRGSILNSLSHVLKDSYLVSAFNHLSQEKLLEINEDLLGDVLVCSDHREAKLKVIQLVEKIKNLRAIDAGNSDFSGIIEGFTSILISINRKYGVQSSIKIVNLDK